MAAGPGRGAWPNRAAAVVVGLIALGAALEVLQAFVGRQPDVVDLLADAAGVVVAAGLWWLARGWARSTSGP